MALRRSSFLRRGSSPIASRLGSSQARPPRSSECRNGQSRSAQPLEPPRAASIEGRGTLEFLHDFLPLLNNPHNGIASLGARPLNCDTRKTDRQNVGSICGAKGLGTIWHDAGTSRDLSEKDRREWMLLRTTWLLQPYQPLPLLGHRVAFRRRLWNRVLSDARSPNSVRHQGE